MWTGLDSNNNWPGLLAWDWVYFLDMEPEIQNSSNEAVSYGGKSAFSQMEHNIVAGYLIAACKKYLCIWESVWMWQFAIKYIIGLWLHFCAFFVAPKKIVKSLLLGTECRIIISY